MNSLRFHYRWHFEVNSTPTELWPSLSDTNQFFKDLGHYPIHEILLKRDLPKNHLQIACDPLHRLDAWIEEPFQWEAPYGYSVKRHYQNGHFKELTFSVELTRLGNETHIAITHAGTAKNKISLLRIKLMFSNKYKRKLRKTLFSYDQDSKIKNPEKSDSVRNRFNNRKHRENLIQKLSLESRKPVASKKLIMYLKTSDEQKLKAIHPADIASALTIQLHEAIELLLKAASLEILIFNWNLVCPDCKNHVQSVSHLFKITGHLYCNSCETTFKPDFNKTIQLVFQPHPLVRKLSNKNYCLGSPANRSHIVMRQYIRPGKKQFLKVRLSPGKYRLFTDRYEGTILIDVKENGPVNNILRIKKGNPAGQKISLSASPNLILHNQTGRRVMVSLEKADWIRPVVASEITSLQTFRNHFPNELIRDEEKFHSSDLTVMFTDLFNSSQMYSTEGDESAIKQVMDHFEILRRAVDKERGAIVKTIGDSIMAVFRSPLHALRAFLNAQEEIKKQTKTGKIKLKAGIHTGDCIAVTLNNRIDYFGKTVNISARLVEQAYENELVVSNDVFMNSDFQTFLQTEVKKLNICNLDTLLRGYENQLYTLKKISPEKSEEILKISA